MKIEKLQIINIILKIITTILLIAFIIIMLKSKHSSIGEIVLIGIWKSLQFSVTDFLILCGIYQE